MRYYIILALDDKKLYNRINNYPEGQPVRKAKATGVGECPSKYPSLKLFEIYGPYIPVWFAPHSVKQGVEAVVSAGKCPQKLLNPELYILCSGFVHEPPEQTKIGNQKQVGADLCQKFSKMTCRINYNWGWKAKFKVDENTLCCWKWFIIGHQK